MPTESKANRLAADRREVRVFISSTFRDMQEEREELVKQVFPQLRRLCESRGVTWGEVDLRWGVPDEAKAEGKVLPLCLQEIEKCRPYFIGLLGERYGWVPKETEIPAVLFETQPWLREHLHQSVTALEVFHGVLGNPEMNKHAFFYFRDPAYAAAHPGFTENDPALREKLAGLKDEIRASGFPVSEPFATPKQLGEWVLRDLTAIVEELYPERDLDPLDRIAFDHEAYSASRRAPYIGRQTYVDRLDAHAAGDGPPLVVLGESGGGKSALLANWTHNWSADHPDTPVLVHFIGASPDSANWTAMLRRLLREFQRKCGIQLEIPDQPDALRATFVNALHMVAARGRLVLAIDALNQIQDRDGAPDLVWLPPEIPANLRLIVSTLSGRSCDNLKKRGWPVLTVGPLNLPERKELISRYLVRYAKTLSQEPARLIASAPQTGNGLYLSTLLNELRQFGSHEKLDQRIRWYLEAEGPLELYRKVIERWEQDYGKPETVSGAEGEKTFAQRMLHALQPKSKSAHKSVVQESLVRIWAARRGLSETELLESMGTAGSPLPRAVWSPLYLAAGDALVNRGGLLTFAHDFLREAVREAYLPDASEQQGAHRTLADYFGNRPFDSRPMDEMPWQLQEAAEWQRLADLLTHPGLFGLLWQEDEFEVKAYWAQIEAHSPLRMEHVYDSVIQEPTQDAQYAGQIGMLLGDTGKNEAALRIRARLVAHYRDQSDRTNLEAALGNQALILKACGDPEGALALQKEQEQICRELRNKDGLQSSLGNQALILKDRGDLDGAWALLEEAERICRELGNKGGLERSLGAKANILNIRGDLDGAMALYKETERICRELGNKEGLSISLNNQSGISYNRGNLDEALTLLREDERICRELGNKDGLQGTLGNQALILQARGDLDGAMLLHKEKENICRELEAKNSLWVSLNNQGEILRARGDLGGAMVLYKESERICRELGNSNGILATLNNQALILHAHGNLDGAMALHKEQERICRELGNKDRLSGALGNQANILSDRGDLEGAMALYREQERICRELGNPQGLSISLVNQANNLRRLPGRMVEARRLADEALSIATRHGYQQLVPQFGRIRDAIPNE
jgi:tetratricopeptide (TPR) repeat protein